MALLKVIELIAESELNWEDATQNAVKEASQSMRNIRSVYVKNLTAVVDDGIIKKWRINCKMTFEKE